MKEQPIKPEDLPPKQAVIDPTTGRDITGDFMEQAKNQTEVNLEDIETEEQLGSELNSYFNSIKQPSDKQKIDKLKLLFKELKQIGEISKESNLTYKISLKPKLSFEFGWQTDETGLWIAFYNDDKPNSTLFALPLTNLQTNKYAPYFLGGEPPAADIITCNKNMILFSSSENHPPTELINKISDKEEDFDLLPMTSGKKQGALLKIDLDDPNCVDCAVGHSKEEIIEELKKHPEIKALSIGEAGSSVWEIIAL